MSAACDVAAARAWLDLLYADCPGFVTVAARPTFSGTSFATTGQGLDGAAELLARKASLTDAYVGCCTLTAPPTRGRGTSGDVMAVPGLWCDLDVAGPGHAWRDDDARNLRLPADEREALQIVDDLGVEPSCVVHSGHGLYAWWLFSEPLMVTSEAERTDVEGLSARFGATLIELGARRGFHVDNVSDLARILRPPGTVNRKTSPVPVRLVECRPERRYTPADLAARCIIPEPIAAPTRPSRPRLSSRFASAESPAEAFGRIVPWADILEPAGFTLMSEHGETGYWHHRDSTSGPASTSATTHHGAPVLVVFSESASATTGLPLGAGHKLTKFRTWAILNYHGDESAAASALRAVGRVAS